MKSASAALIEHLNTTDKFLTCDLYEITLKTGQIVRACTADCGVNYGNDYSPYDLIIERSKIKLKRGLAVDNLSLTITPRSGATVAGVSWMTAAISGLLDGASVLVRRAYLSEWPNIIGAVHLFAGTIGDIEPDGFEIRASVENEFAALNTKIPKNVCQASCMHTLYDSGCGVDKLLFRVDATILNVASDGRVLTLTHSSSGTHFEQGMLEFTSGASDGIKRTIRSHSGNVFTLAAAPSVAPSIGDSVRLLPGCTKAMDTCKARFNNIIRFKGMPYVPEPETAL